MNIDDLIEKEKLILIDTSAIKMPDNLLYQMSHINEYGQINMGLIEEGIIEIDNMIQFIDKPNVRVIPEVIREIERLENVVKRSIIKAWHVKRNYYEPGRLLSQLDFMTEILLSKSKHSRLEYDNEDFKTMANITALLSDRASLKKTKATTDDRLIAYALYESLFNRKRTGLLSRDRDIKKILYVTSKVISSGFMSPNNNVVYDRQRSNPVTLYHRRDDEIFESLSTNKLLQENVFQIRGLSYQDNLHVMNQVKTQLTTLNGNLSNTNQAYTN